MSVVTPVEGSLTLGRICKAYLVSIGDLDLLAALFVLDMRGFGVILGMNLLSTFQDRLDSFEKTVTFSIPGESPFQFQYDSLEDAF